VIREAHHGGLHEEFKLRIKTQTVLPSVETAAIWFWALMPSGQIAMRKGDGWRTPAERPSETMDLAASSSNLVPMEIAPKQFPTTPATAFAAGKRSPQRRARGGAPHQSKKMRLMTPLSGW
jgi:hypothetical protein